MSRYVEQPIAGSQAPKRHLREAPGAKIQGRSKLQSQNAQRSLLFLNAAPSRYSSRFNSSRISAADWKRFSTAFSQAFTTILLMRKMRVFSAVLSMNTVGNSGNRWWLRPVHSSYNTLPRLKISEAALPGPSGGM